VSLSTPWRHTGVEVQIHSFLTSALKGGQWWTPRPGQLYPCYPLNRRLGGPQSWSGPLGDLPACSLLTILTELPRISCNHHRLIEIVSVTLDDLWSRLHSDQSIITSLIDQTEWSRVMRFTGTAMERKAHQLFGFSHSVVTRANSGIACYKSHATLFLTDPKHSTNLVISFEVK
jgi:hypothetical protein